MAISIQLSDFLESHHSLSYETLTHQHSNSSLRTSEMANIPGDAVAKSVLLKVNDDYLLAVLPATRRIHFGHLHQLLNRYVGLATENEVAQVFDDCEIGAIPPTGLLYDVDTIVDEALLEQPEIYFEAGDHEHLIHMDRQGFGKLMGDANRLQLS